MHEDIKISVLITTYNLSKFIDQTLSSVLEQDLDYKYEVLIGDDGSSDRTVEIIREWIKRYPTVIKLYIWPREAETEYNPICRASLNRVNLIKYAKGEYITFLDGDDVYIDKSKLKKQILILDNPENNDCIMCAHNMNFWWDKSNDTKPVLPVDIIEQKIFSKKYWERYSLPAENFIFRNIFRTKDFTNFDIKYFDDNLIVFFFLKYGNVYYLPDLMVNYRQNPTPWKSLSNLESNLINAMDFCIEKKYNPAMYKLCVRRHYGNFKELYINKRNLGKPKLKKYIEQAQNDRLTEISLFLNYSRGSVKEKLQLHCLFIFMSIVCWRRYFAKWYGYLYWEIFSPCKQKILKIFQRVF